MSVSRRSAPVRCGVVVCGVVAASLVLAAGCHPFQEADGEFPDLVGEGDTSTGDTDTSRPDVDVPPDGTSGDVDESEVADADAISPDDTGQTEVSDGEDLSVDAVLDGDMSVECETFEICANGIDDNCDGRADEGQCIDPEGLFVTTFGTAMPGDTEAGSLEHPFGDLNHAIEAADVLGGVPIHIATGEYGVALSQPLTVDGVSLLGGYDCPSAQMCTWTRDLGDDTARSKFELAGDNGLVVESAITQNTRIEGLYLIGNGSLGAGLVNSTLTVRGGTPRIAHNRFVGGVVGEAALDECPEEQECASVTVEITGPGRGDGQLLKFANNVIVGGDAPGHTAVALRIDGQSPPPVEVSDNRIGGGRGVHTRGIFARLPAARSGTISSFRRNRVDAGPSDGGNSYAMWVEGAPDIEANFLNTGAGPGAVGACASNQHGSCGGLYLTAGLARVTNNVIFGVDGPESVALDIVINSALSANGGGTLVYGNTLDAGAIEPMTTAAGATALRCRVDGNVSSVTPIGFGTVIGNVLSVGRSAEQRVGLLASRNESTSTDCRPTAFKHNAFFDPGGGGGSDAPSLYTEYQGTGYVSRDLETVNADVTRPGNLVVTTNVFVDYPHNLYPAAGSDLVDNGYVTQNSIDGRPDKDIVGTTRPQGPVDDIGAYEQIP